MRQFFVQKLGCSGVWFHNRRQRQHVLIPARTLDEQRRTLLRCQRQCCFEVLQGRVLITARELEPPTYSKVLGVEPCVTERDVWRAQLQSVPCVVECLTVQGVMPRDADFKQTLCADSNGFSLHAAVHCGADDRQALEQLCRYITRPALANERVQTNAAGQVVLKLKTPWRDGTTHLVMSPLEFMQRLAALVPRPRLHLIRFHGVLAPCRSGKPA